jgi:hypothetical protein
MREPPFKIVHLHAAPNPVWGYCSARLLRAKPVPDTANDGIKIQLIDID